MTNFIKTLLVLTSLLLGKAVYVEAIPTKCPTDPSVIGFSTWDDLKQSSEIGGLKILCPNTLFIADHEIVIYQGTTIQCGSHGLENDKCIIQGGLRQFNVVGEGAQFRGLTMSGAMNAFSVQTKFGSDTYFKDCVFEDNDAGPEMGFGAAGSVYAGGQVFFQNCVFQLNSAVKATVDVDGGSAVFDSCIFDDNVALGATMYIGGSAIHVRGMTGEVSISNSCFFNNRGPSLVYLSSHGSLVLNVDNYESDNENSLFNCNGAFHDNEDLLCEKFVADTCGPTMPSAAPTAGPSMQPSSAPSQGPSSLPSDLPSMFPTTNPSDRPSNVPSSSMFPTTNPSDSPSNIPSPFETFSESPPLPQNPPELPTEPGNLRPPPPQSAPKLPTEPGNLPRISDVSAAKPKNKVKLQGIPGLVVALTLMAFA